MAYDAAKFDVLILGAGLQGALLALRLAEKHPHLRLGVLEAQSAFAHPPTWSFHETDFSSDALAWLRRIPHFYWDSYQVCFPKRERVLPSAYGSISGEAFYRWLRGQSVFRSFQLGAPVEAIQDLGHVTQVRLRDGRQLEAELVFDARGTRPDTLLETGFQKFVGLELEFERPHGFRCPMVMDASVPQLDGFRFIYVLPWTSTTALIEDTYYTDGPELNVLELRNRIFQWLGDRNLRVKLEIREERGVLPIPMSTRFASEPGTFAVGMRGGFFQRTTGYSLPLAVQMAWTLGDLPRLSRESVHQAVSDFALSKHSNFEYCELLNRMIFKVARPEQRYVMLERFYGLREGLVQRFYANSLTLADRIRILSGRPPVPLLPAFLEIGRSFFRGSAAPR